MIKKGLVGFSLTGDPTQLRGSRHAGEFFGEVALLESVPEQSTAVAQTDCEFYVLAKTAFDDLLKTSVAAAMDDLHAGVANIMDQDEHPHEVSAKVQAMLKEYDNDADGQFSVEEVEVIISNIIIHQPYEARQRLQDSEWPSVSLSWPYCSAGQCLR